MRNNTTSIWKGNITRDWNWPLRVGIYESSGILAARLRKVYWPGQLTITRKISRTNTKLDILFINSVADIKRFLNQNSNNLIAGIVIVNVDRSSYIKLTTQSANELALHLRERTKSAGVIYFSSNFPIEDWYDQFVINLSHNFGVIDAIRSVPKTYTTAFATKDLNKLTRLSVVVDRLIHQILDARILSTKKIPVRQSDGQRIQMNLLEVAYYFEYNFKSLPYTHESGTASTIKEVSMALSRKPKNGRGLPPIPRPDSTMKGFRYPHISLLTGKKHQEVYRDFPGKPTAKKKAAKKQSPPGEGRRLPVRHYKDDKSPGTSSGKRLVRKDREITRRPVKKAAAKKAVKKAFEPAVRKSSGIKTKKVEKKLQPRYLQAAFRKPRSKSLETTHLPPNTKYELGIKIAQQDTQFLPVTTKFPDKGLFKEKHIKEVTIDLEVRFSNAPIPIHKKLTLPRSGESEIVYFKLTTPKKSGILQTEILAYHCNRLLQHAKLSISVVKAGTKTYKKSTFNVEAVLRKELQNIEDRPKFGGTMIFPADPDNKPVAGRCGNNSLPFRFTPAMKSVVDKIKEIIEDLALTSGPAKLTDDSNQELLKKLANQGSLLYSTYLKNMDLKGPLQLVNNTGDYLPLDFAYTLLAPDQNSKLCQYAVDALKEGECRGCIKTVNDQRNNICPFGFWALSQIVERHHYQPGATTDKADYILEVEPCKDRQELALLKNALHGASDKVNAGNKSLTKTVCNTIGKHCGKITTAKNWKSWSQAVPGNPDSLILIVHVEENPVTSVDALEIGSDLLDQTQLDARYIPAAKNGKGPFFILIGCETTKTDAYMFDTVGQLFRNGAAIVVSNFTEILGEQAAEVVMQLVELLKQNAGKEIRFGEVMLKLRQQLVAKGLLVGLSVLAHGDTDWKIKV